MRMSKKIMLITGASKGIGLDCYNKFKNQFEVVTAHRSTGADFQGDLTDINFQDKLIDSVTPDVFINNAGGITTDPFTTLNLNGYTACRLLMAFHKKMTAGSIINISSIAANEHGWVDMDYNDIAYTSAKKMLSTMSLALYNQKSKPVKVSCLELGPTYTDAFYQRVTPSYPPEDTWTNQSQTPLSTNDVIDVIKNILAQPIWANTTIIRLDTNSKCYGN